MSPQHDNNILNNNNDNDDNSSLYNNKEILNIDSINNSLNKIIGYIDSNKCINKDIMLNNLKNITFKEKFNSKYLTYIIDNYQLFNINEKELVQYQSYLNYSNKGICNIKYKYNSNITKIDYLHIGRLYGSFSQFMKKDIRNTIFTNYLDLDIVNCHPMIIYNICNYFNYECIYLEEYINNRDIILKELILLNDNLTNDDIKKIIIEILYGGTKSYKILKKTDWLTNYFNEINQILIALCNQHFKSIFDKIKKNSLKEYNYEGTTISYICQIIENQLLHIIYKHFSEIKYPNINNSFLMFDGITIPKNENINQTKIEQIIFDIENIFIKNYDFPIKLKLKDMIP